MRVNLSRAERAGKFANILGYLYSNTSRSTWPMRTVAMTICTTALYTLSTTQRLVPGADKTPSIFPKNQRAHADDVANEVFLCGYYGRRQGERISAMSKTTHCDVVAHGPR